MTTVDQKTLPVASKQKVIPRKLNFEVSSAQPDGRGVF